MNASSIANWISQNKFVSIVILALVLAFLFKNHPVRTSFHTKNTLNYGGTASYDGERAPTLGMAPEIASDSSVRGGVIPTATGRQFIAETYFSIQVDDVQNRMGEVISNAVNTGGFLVNSNITRPLESPVGTVTVRVPVDRAGSFINFIRDLSIKVVSENISGRDVTSQYEDNEARLITLEKTKTIFENMLDQTQNIDQLLRIQREIINLQSQMDSIKTQQIRLEEMSSTVAFTVYLSTDEFGLPYAPDNNWRPEVAFKMAVRSLVISLRGLAESAIWIGVYAVIWLPIFIFGYIAYKLARRRMS